METILSQFELMIISKYFKTITDYTNLSKTCKKYNIADKYTYNPLPIDIDQLLIFGNLNTIIIENTDKDYGYIDMFMSYNKSILKHLNRKLNIVNKTNFPILQFEEYFDEIQINLSFKDWINGGCNSDVSKYVTKINSYSINNDQKLSYIILPKNVKKICENSIVNCPNLSFIIYPNYKSNLIIHENSFKDCPQFQGIICKNGYIHNKTSIINDVDLKNVIEKYSKYNCMQLTDFIVEMIKTNAELKEGLYYKSFGVFISILISEYNKPYKLCKICKTPKNIYLKPYIHFFFDIDKFEEYFIIIGDYYYYGQFYNYAYINQQLKLNITEYPNFKEFVSNDFKSSNSESENSDIFYARYSVNDLYEDIINFGEKFKIMKINKSLLGDWCITCSTNIDNFKTALENAIGISLNKDEFINEIIERRFTGKTNYNNEIINKLKTEDNIELINDFQKKSETTNDPFIDMLFTISKDDMRKLIQRKKILHLI